MGKDKKDVCFGCTTIMMIVIITSFILVLYQNSNTLIYLISVQQFGDMDILIMPKNINFGVVDSDPKMREQQNIIFTQKG